MHCYHDDEIPTVNVATSAHMLATERSVRTLDTTPPSFGTFSCVETQGTEVDEGARATAVAPKVVSVGVFGSMFLR